MALRSSARAAALAWARGRPAWSPAGPGAPAIGGAAATSLPAFSSSPSTLPPPSPPSSSELNALLYRARQRGFLELDILLGKWADENAASLDGAGRAALADLLRAENPDLFAWLTGQAAPPPAVAANPVFAAIAGDIAAKLRAGAPAAARAAAGVAWKRGWDDKGEAKRSGP
jgi:succinate dehydrogenase flavin-adding protein (antitoxin of CptAB toxin-antitoxin module)